MSKNFQRSLLLALVAMALIVAAPTFAAGAPPAGATAAIAPATAGAPGCGASLDFVADLARQSAAPAACPADFGASPAEPTPLARGFRGYCRCSCSFTKNCNTSADCGGSACLGGVTCC